MALTTVSSDRLSTNVKTSNLGTELSKKVGQSKNLIINGAMQVAQRGTSSTSDGFQTVDRFSSAMTGQDEAPTYAQVDVASGTTPYTLGFRKAFKITNGNQTSGAGASDFLFFHHQIEAQNVATSGWNYTSASSFITLSFWVKSSVAQNFYGYLRSRDGTEQRYAFETGSLSADTWTKVTKTISGNSNIQIDNNNGSGLGVYFAPFFGTTYTDSGVSLNAWGAYASGTRTPDSTSTWYTTNDATLEITGLQLEVGSVATDFEHRSFGQELALCQRYYYIHCEGDNKTVTENGTHYNSSYIFASFAAPVAMRAAPSIEAVTGSNYYVTHSNNQQTALFSGTGITSAYSGTSYLSIQTTEGSGTQGHATIWRTNNASARIAYTAEL